MQIKNVSCLIDTKCSILYGLTEILIKIFETLNFVSVHVDLDNRLLEVHPLNLFCIISSWFSELRTCSASFLTMIFYKLSLIRLSMIRPNVQNGEMCYEDTRFTHITRNASLPEYTTKNRNFTFQSKVYTLMQKYPMNRATKHRKTFQKLVHEPTSRRVRGNAWFHGGKWANVTAFRAEVRRSSFDLWRTNAKAGNPG